MRSLVRMSAPRQRVESLDEMFDEKVELPCELLDVEGDAIGDVLWRRELGASSLHRRDQRDGLSIEGRVFGGTCGAEVSLKRDVSEIGQRENAEIVGVTEHRRNRHRHLGKQSRDVYKR